MRLASGRCPFLKNGQAPLEIRSAKDTAASRLAGLFLTGQATLAFIILISGIIIEIAVAGSFITYFLGASSLGERLSARALVAAEAGTRDAQIKITRNKEFTSGSTNYILNIGGDTAAVQVSRSSDSPNNLYVYTITSTGLVGNRQRRLVATVTVNQTTGLVQFKSLTEQALQ